MPDKGDFEDFVNNYDFELTTLNESGKTVYVLKEIKKKPIPITNGLSLLPQDVQDAFENLLDRYPSLTTSSGGVSNGGGAPTAS